MIGGGSVLVIIFGVILALKSDRFEIWNFWILAGIVLWAVMGDIGRRTGNYYTAVEKLAETGDASEQEVMAGLRAPTGYYLHLATVAVFVLLVLDMIFKPFE